MTARSSTFVLLLLAGTTSACPKPAADVQAPAPDELRRSVSSKPEGALARQLAGAEREGDDAGTHAGPPSTTTPAPGPGLAEPCLPLPADEDPSRVARSRDGRITAFIQTDPDHARVDPSVEGDWPHEDLCAVTDGSPPRLLVAGGTATTQDRLGDFASLLFSPDGKTLYFTSAGWATSPAAHAVDVTTGTARFVTDGVIVATLERGPYKGMLLAVHFRLDFEHQPNRGRHEMWEVMTSDGKAVRGLPEGECARRRAIEGR